MDKYIRKNVTFNRHSKKHMAIWNWCLSETEEFKAQNFSDFVREKLEWCMRNGNNNTFIPVVIEPKETGWKNLI
jgi:hypothetical protein